ncbi:L-threonylcarbamoyladenylate synthase [Hydrogenoanaerobacterium sp.]|uniref:L-threonylcarbamoyladenylate synthase n=1 Tax=Hydrogenoanaerobacterium sp. TaxID=2953763 RepID=UPI0028A26409|nr:L-threonylcarbamoyladenylate synthase [Hydrogenoanaerobacterium sp.]
MRDTKILKIQNISGCEKELDEAASILASGGLVAIPTETVYGLAANAKDEAAVKSIFEAKGRPQDNPLIVHICDLAMLAEIVREVPESALKLADRFWPGPLTIILPKSDAIPSVTSAGLDTVAVRFPKHAVARELIRRAGVPVAAPSANLSGSPSTTTAQHCIHDLMGRVDAIVDGGDCEVGVESTVITLVGGTPKLLRPGYVTLEQLREVLGEVLVDKAVTDQPDPDAKVASPGMKYKHYAPQCRVILVEGTQAQYADYVNSHHAEGEFALCYNEDVPFLDCPSIAIGSEQDEAAQAAKLFDSLRRLDEEGAQVVYARCPNQTGVGLALYNRLIRAAAFQVVRTEPAGEAER